MKEKFIYQDGIYREKDAEIILSLLFSAKVPFRVFDIGCGTGTWLRVAQKLGVQQILGFDSSTYDEKHWAISKDEYVLTDIGKPIIFQEKADICFCLEVAEHVEVRNAEKLIKNLVSASDVILFSAAIPGQGGQNHINEQWPIYWEAIFKGLGYRCYDVLRPVIWEDHRIHFWYRQNILLFIKEGVAYPLNLPDTCVLSSVHPDLFQYVKQENQLLKQTIKQQIWHPDVWTGSKIFLKALGGIFKNRKV